MDRRIVFVGLAVVLMSSYLVAAGDPVASDADGLLAQADALYDTHNGEFDFAAYEGRLREAIGLYEEVLPLLQADDTATLLATLHRLARAYFELAEAYIPRGDDQESTYEKGTGYALRSLRLDPEFVVREATSFRGALSNANDVEGVFWYGTDFGCHLGYHRSLTSFENLALMASGPADVRACYERAIELDETFLAAAPLRSLACFLAQIPGLIGGDIVRARELFDRAITIAPEFIQNAVDLSEWVLKPSGDSELCPTLDDVKARAQDPAVMNSWPLYNELALRRAVTLSSDCP